MSDSQIAAITGEMPAGSVVQQPETITTQEPLSTSETPTVEVTPASETPAAQSTTTETAAPATEAHDEITAVPKKNTDMATKEERATEPVAAEAALPITEGQLSYKGPGLLK